MKNRIDKIAKKANILEKINIGKMIMQENKKSLKNKNATIDKDAAKIKLFDAFLFTFYFFIYFLFTFFIYFLNNFK